MSRSLRQAGSRPSLDVQESSVENAYNGVDIIAYDRSTITGRITDLRVDSLFNDGITPSTGFWCSGLDRTFNRFGLDCSKLCAGAGE